jgi:heme exporter protein A
VPIRLEAKSLKKVFNRRIIFRNVSFTLESHRSLLVSGKNGSGKSTLIKILSGVLSSTEGSVTISSGLGYSPETHLLQVGLVSPYLMMYDEFSARENLHLCVAMRGLRPDGKAIDALLERVQLFGRRNDQVRTYSSGMKQRVKYAFALIHRPPILLLDEPMANLDVSGIAMVRTIMAEQREKGILVVATNDASDIDRYDYQVNLDASA